jgi:hypothetical protein
MADGIWLDRAGGYMLLLSRNLALLQAGKGHGMDVTLLLYTSDVGAATCRLRYIQLLRC